MLGLLAATTDAQAATIELAPVGEANKVTIVAVSGKIESGDFQNFRQKTEGWRKRFSSLRAPAAVSSTASKSAP